MTKIQFQERPRLYPKIYAYEDSNPNYKGFLKVGYTSIDVKTRVAQQYSTRRPEEDPYTILLEEDGIRACGKLM